MILQWSTLATCEEVGARSNRIGEKRKACFAWVFGMERAWQEIHHGADFARHVLVNDPHLDAPALPLRRLVAVCVYEVIHRGLVQGDGVRPAVAVHRFEGEPVGARPDEVYERAAHGLPEEDLEAGRPPKADEPQGYTVELTGADKNLIQVIEPPMMQTVVKRLSTKRVRALGWKPEVDLVEGMERTLDWVRVLDETGAIAA